MEKMSENTENSEMTEIPKRERYITTSQAAEFLSVSPDTVLKWARAGKLSSYRTLGGHFRISISSLEAMPSGISRASGEIENASHRVPYQYCWEYFSRGNGINLECQECITYRSGSKRCYELRDLPDGLGCLGVYCKTNCEECDYFSLVKEKGLHVLAVGKMAFLKKASDDTGLRDIHIRFAEDEYECAASIEKFRPDCIVVDCSLGKKRTRTICERLFSDPRIPVVRIILATQNERLYEYCDKEIFGWIRKPFSIHQLKDCIKGV